MGAPTSDLPQAPVAHREDHVRIHHGETFHDPYEWLRERDDPDVLAYLEAENAYAEARTAHLAPLRATLFAEIKSRVKEADLSVPVRSGPWWYYTRTVEGAAYAVQARCPITDPATRPALDLGTAISDEQVILDGNLAADGREFFAVGGLSVSADHARSAVAVDTTGDERFDVVVRDIATDRILDDAVRGVGYGLELSRDGTWLYYTRVDHAWRPFEVWRHRVGSDVAEDVLLHREEDERFWLGVSSSRDDRWLMLSLGSRTTSEVRLLPAEDPTGKFSVVAPRREGVEYDVEPDGDRLLITHNRDNPDMDLAWAPLDATSDTQWQPILAAGPGEHLIGVDAFTDFAVVSLRSGGLPTLAILPREAGASSGYGTPTPVHVPGPAGTLSLGDVAEVDSTSILVVHESWTRPTAVLEYRVATGDLEVLKRQPVLGGFRPEDYREHRIWASASDGTAIPVSVVHRVGVEPDGTAPCLLTAYAAYEMPSDPYFSSARLSLLDRGVVYAVAHARGGGELGRAWYEAGRYERKMTTFTDVVAAANALLSQGWSARDRLGLEGGSAGGLMVGAVTNLAPELFAVVHAQVPFVDPLTTILRPDLPLTVGEWEEWGNPLEDPRIYAAMKAYSPYENIAARQYPAILATTSLHDTRVFFTEPAKWVAALRAIVTNDPQTRPILLRTELAAGHGGRSGRYAAWEQIAWEWAFVVDHLSREHTDSRAAATDPTAHNGHQEHPVGYTG
ncbi:MAG: S9 family peptidase [Nostocoides sp.]